MSLERITIENSVELWSIPSILGYASLSSFFAFFGFIFLFAGITPEPTEIGSFLILSFTIVYVTITSLRNRIIKKLFWRITPAKFLEFTYILEKILIIAMGSLFLVMILLSVIPTEIYDFSQIFLLVFAFVFLYAPIFAFGSAITDSGEIRIAFDVLFSNLNNFDQRQKWMKKLFKKLEEKLNKGYMKVSSDKLIYYCNLKLMNSEDIQNNLRDIERWMLGEQIENIVSSIKQIIPAEEIKPIEKPSILDRFLQIPTDYIKILFLAIILVIIAVRKPELVERFISEIM